MRILIADDHDLLRDTLALFFKSESGLEPITVGTLQAAHDLIMSEGHFDLVLLDYNMPGMRGLEGLTSTLQLNGGQRVALMSGEATREIAEKALEAGAAGFVPKKLPAKSMINAVKFMAMGEKYAPIDFMTAQDDEEAHPLTSKLSSRELQVLEGLTKGKANKEIARDLDIMEPTVKLHLKSLFRKLDVSNRTQAAMIAQEAGLF